MQAPSSGHTTVPGPVTGTAAPVAGEATVCAACTAAMRPGAPWCTLCLTPARVPEPVAPVAPVVPLVPAMTPVRPPATSVDPLTAPLSQVLGGPSPAPAGWPCTTCSAVNTLDATSCAACGAGFLAAVASEGDAAYLLPIVGDVRNLSAGQRAALALGAATCVVLIVALLGVLSTLVG